MELVLLAAIVLIFKFVKEKWDQDRPYYGTSRDKYRDNPNFIESRRRADEICNKQRAEYEKRTGKKADW